MSIRLYNDALLDHANNPSHPTEDDIPKELKSPKKRKTVAVIAVVVVIVVIASVGTVIVTDQHHSLHIAVISKAKAADFIKQPLFDLYMNDTNGNASRNITSLISVIFANNTNFFAGNSTEWISIQSIELTSANYSLYLYNYEYNESSRGINGTKIPGFQNGTYDGFNFFYLTQVDSTVHKEVLAFAIGVSGAYSFFIGVRGIPISNYLTLIQDEIQAMTS